MEAEIIYGTDEKGRLYTKSQLGGEVLAIQRWKSIQHYADDKPSAKITEHSHDIGSINVSSGNSRHIEPMVGVVWSSEPPLAPSPPRRILRPDYSWGDWHSSMMEVLRNE